MRGALTGAPHRFLPLPIRARGDRSARRAAAPRPRGRLQRLGKPSLKVFLQSSTLEPERRPAAHHHPSRGRAQQVIRQRYRFPDPAPKRDVELADQSNPYEAGPRDPACDSTSTGSHIRDLVMRDQVVDPFRGGLYRK